MLISTVRAENADAVALRKGSIGNMPSWSQESTFWRRSASVALQSAGEGTHNEGLEFS